MLCCAVLCYAALRCDRVCWLHAHVCNVGTNVQEMDSELERYHKSCAALELNVGEGSLKQAGLHKELARQRSQTQDAHQAIRYVGGPSPPSLRFFFSMHHSSSFFRRVLLLLLLASFFFVLPTSSSSSSS